MRKITTLTTILFIVILSTASYAQPGANKNVYHGSTSGASGKNFRVKWKTDPFDDHEFIENKGQFDGQTKPGEKILYCAHLGKVSIFFTSSGLIYRYDKYYKVKDADPDADKSADPDADEIIKHDTFYLHASWENANKNTTISCTGELSNYYTYSIGKNTIKANLFKELSYRNLYPGVDAVFQFVKGKTGLKYALIVHPGADLSQIKINYSDIKNISQNKDGDIIIKSSVDMLTEHAPQTSYTDGSGNIAFSNVVNGNTESFKADENYDHSKTIVIDPWITDPLFFIADEAYDLSWDYFGNVYAYGGGSYPFQLVKMNKLGAIQWTFFANNISGDYGAFTTDKVTGTSYLCQGFSGAEVLKVNSNGTLVGTFTGYPAQMNEFWRARFDPCNRDIVIAGGGVNGTYQACVLDTDMASYNPVNILGATGPFHDIALIAIDPDGYYCYMASARSFTVDPLHFNNVLMKLPLPSLSPTAYEVHDSCHFIEVHSIQYASTETNGMNGAAASPDWLYLYNSDTLRRYHKNNGAFSNDFPIRQNSAFEFGGLDVDPCDNLFIGVEDSIYVVDSTYAIQAKIPLDSTVFDVQLGQKGALYACGIGFVTQIINPVTPNLISSAAGTPSSCSACNGTATVNVNCGIEPYLFNWSDGSTNETDTGLCAGVYTVVVMDAACPPSTDTAVVNVTGENGFSAFISDTNPECTFRKGNATIHVVGGYPPYFYNWNNGSTNTTDTGLVAGTYVCIVTDSSGCKFEVGVKLVNPTNSKLSLTPAKDSLCVGSSIGLTISGAHTYIWSPVTTLSCDSCANPTATPTLTTTYKVLAIDTLGCKDSVYSTILVYPVPKPIITGKDTVCSGYIDTLSATGGNSYLWSNGATTSSINYQVANTQTITVTAYEGMCSHDTTYVIHTINPAAKITASKDSICLGDSVLLGGSGGTSYKWNTGNTTTNIWVKPLLTKTYTLYAYGPTCYDSATIKIKIIPQITVSINSKDSICPNHSTIITAQSNGGQTTYKWNTGATGSSITVQDTVTTIYTVTAYGICDSVQKTMTVTVVPLPKPVIIGTMAKCKGQSDTLVVTNSVNPATYLWNNGETSTTIYTGSINVDSTFYVTAFNNLGCPVTDTFHVKVKPNPTANIAYPPGCGTTITPITVTPSGTGPFTYKWNTGGTNDTIDVFINADTTTYTVVVMVGGCSPITKTVQVIKYFPPLSACCDARIYVGGDTTITANGANIVSYKWIPDTALNCDTCPTVIANPTVTTTYTVIGTDAQGCESESTVTITIEIPCFNLTIPNVFTPTNGGMLGLDKVFYIKTENIDGWSLSIYDRWGKEMYSSTNPNEYWDGNTKGGGAAPAGVYYYIISGTCQNNTYKKAGFVQLIR